MEYSDDPPGVQVGKMARWKYSKGNTYTHEYPDGGHGPSTIDNKIDHGSRGRSGRPRVTDRQVCRRFSCEGAMQLQVLSHPHENSWLTRFGEFTGVL